MTNYTFEHLISAVKADAAELVEKMNLKTDGILINQQDENYYNKFNYKKNTIQEYSFDERGVGLSRNTALQRATADICIVSDDDMVYEEDYIETIEKAYRDNPEADMILFNVRIHENGEVIEKSSYNGKIHYLNSLKYGTVTFTFKRNAVYKNRIAFSLLFGGGARFSNGEDNLFLWDCLKSGMQVYANGNVIADVYNEQSSWFEGYNEKYFLDRGALFEALTPKYSTLLIYQYALRKKDIFKKEFTVSEAISLMKKGKRDYKKANY